MSKVNVAHIVGSFLPITENWIYNQIINIKDFYPIVLAYKKENLDSFLFKEVYSVVDDHGFVGLWYQKILRKLFYGYYPYFKEIIKRNGVCLLHSHFGTTGYYTMLLNREFKLPHIVTFYGYDVSSLARIPKWQKRYIQLFEEVDMFLIEGPHMKKCLIELGCEEKKIIVQHLGVDLTKLPFYDKENRERKKIKIMIAASFVEKKGIPYAIRAFAEAKKAYSAIELTIIGDGKMRDELKVLVEDLKISDDVRFLGYVEPERLYQEMLNSDIFLSPSITAIDGNTEGGAPVALIEAQAMGLPVVSSFHADIPEVVIDGVTGFLSPEKDVENIAKKLEMLVSDPELRSKFGNAGRKHVEDNFNLFDQVLMLENIYGALLKEGF